MKEWLKPRSVFACMFYSVACWQLFKGMEVKPELWGIVNLLMGFYFGNKVASTAGQ